MNTMPDTRARPTDPATPHEARHAGPGEPSRVLQVVAVPAGERPPALPGRARPAPGAAPHREAPGDPAAEIGRIQREIAARRRRRGLRLLARLVVLVGLPTALAGAYFAEIATPLYETHSEFVIQQADPLATAGGPPAAGAAPGGPQQDSIAVQAYLSSRDALARLDADLGFAAHFAAPGMDPLHRLDAGATREAAFRLYQRVVRIGFDPTEGVVRMDVRAADPSVSAAFSAALIGYAEEQIDALTQRLRAGQMEGAEAAFARAEARVAEAQERVVALQERLGVVSAEAEVTNSYAQIAAVEAELREARAALDRLLANARPQEARVDVARQGVTRLEAQLDGLRGGLTRSQDADGSLARTTAELQVAQADLSTRQLLLQQAAQQLETARGEAARQVRYLSTPVPPTAPDEPTHPKVAENTLLAFLIFAGLYLAGALTVATLREQS